MPLTFTGRNVDTVRGHPSLIDIAVGLHRMPRFAGQTQRWFSVLDHSLFVEHLAAGEEHSRVISIALLLHDAHECLTGDVPTPLKPRELTSIQQGLDIGIMEAFMPGGRRGYHDLHDLVKSYDRRAVSAEAWHLFGPSLEGHLAAFHITDETMEQVMADNAELARLLGRGILGEPPGVFNPDQHPTVQAFLNRILELL